MYSGALAPESSSVEKTQLQNKLRTLHVKGAKSLTFNPLIISCCSSWGSPELELRSTCALPADQLKHESPLKKFGMIHIFDVFSYGGTFTTAPPQYFLH